MEDANPTPPADDQAAHARPEALRALADANRDATFGDGEDGEAGGLARVPGAGLITGEVGPKGRVSGQLRGLSRRERSTYGQVPHGTAMPGGGRYILLLVVAIILVCALLLLALGWLTR